MNITKLSISAFLLVAGLAFSAWQGVASDSWCTAIVLALSTLYLVAVFLTGIHAIFDPTFMFCAAIIGALGFGCITATSNAANLKLLGARYTVSERLGKVQMYCRQSINVELLRVAEFGSIVCMTAHSSDQMKLLFDLSKSQVLGVGGGMIDAVVQAASQKNTDACAVVYEKVMNICPAAFVGMPSEEREALLELIQ